MPDHKKGGRPPEKGERKRSAIAVRTTTENKAKLEAAALEEGRSITQEVEARLEASLIGNRSAETERLFSDLSVEIERAEELTGKRWHKDLRTWAMVREALFRGPIVRRMPEDDRLLSDTQGDIAEMRRVLAHYSSQLMHLMTSIGELGGGVGSNPDAFNDLTATRYVYDRKEAIENAPPEHHPAILKLMDKMESVEAMRAKLAGEYVTLHGWIIDEADAAVADWRADLERRGIAPIDEYHPGSFLVGGKAGKHTGLLMMAATKDGGTVVRHTPLSGLRAGE